MKPLVAMALAALAFTANPANAAVLMAGDKIGVDFGPTTPTNNMNMVGTVGATTWNDPGSLAAGTMIDTSGTTVDNIGFSWTATGEDFRFQNDDPIAPTTSGLPFNDSNVTDWFGVGDNTPRTTNTITLTFTGLNNLFTYDLVIGARFGTDTVADTSWTVDGQTLLADASSDTDAYRSFTGLSTDGAGNLVMTGTGAGSRTDIAVVSALQLTAVPEPSAALLGGLGLLALLRRRR